MIPAGHRLDQRAFDVAGRPLENRSACTAGSERLAADGLPLRRHRLEERIGRRLLRLAKDVEGERASLFDDLVRARHSVVPLILATRPRATTSRRNSETDHLASGTPASVGSSQAIRFTSTTTPGGKAGCSPASQLLIEAGEALLEEALAPLADDLPWGIQPRGNDIVGQSLCGEQDELGANDISIR